MPPTLTSRLVAGVRSIASIYCVGVHVREDVFARHFSVVCAGRYEHGDGYSNPYWITDSETIEHTVPVDIGAAITRAQHHLERACFTLYNNEEGYWEPANFIPLTVSIRDTEENTVLNATVYRDNGWKLYWLEPACSPEEVEWLEKVADELDAEASHQRYCGNYENARRLQARACELLQHIVSRDWINPARNALAAARARDASIEVQTLAALTLHHSQAIATA